MIVGDKDPAWIAPAFSELFRVMKKNTFCVSFYGWPHAEAEFPTLFDCDGAADEQSRADLGRAGVPGNAL